MNAPDELDEMERRLLALTPAPLPNALDRRLRAAAPRRRSVWLLSLTGCGLGLSLFLLLMNPEGHLPPPDAPRLATTRHAGELSPEDLRVYLPIQQTSTLVKMEELGVLETDPRRPVQILRATWVDDVTYRGDDGISTLQRQESRTEILPVALPTY